jgi:hypothetical protein
MTSLPSIADEAESFLRSHIVEVTRLRENECLCCYVARLLDEFPCDGRLTHALRYRDMAAPRATALKSRLGQVGGFCDCEIFMNGYQLLGADEEADSDEDDDVDEDAGLYVGDVIGKEAEPQELPPCQGVRRGSVKPCSNWVRIPRFPRW